LTDSSSNVPRKPAMRGVPGRIICRRQVSGDSVKEMRRMLQRLTIALTAFALAGSAVGRASEFSFAGTACREGTGQISPLVPLHPERRRRPSSVREWSEKMFCRAGLRSRWSRSVLPRPGSWANWRRVRLVRRQMKEKRNRNSSRFS